MPNPLRTKLFLSCAVLLAAVVPLSGCQDEGPSVPHFDLPPAVTVQAGRVSVVTSEDTPVEFRLSVTASVAVTATVRVLEAPRHGVVIQQGTLVRYTPDPDFFGADGLTYVARVSNTTSDPATVAITVTPVNDPPQLEPLEFAVFENDAFSGWVDVFDIEGDDVELEMVTAPAHGTLTIDNLLERFTYTPVAGYAGPDSFWIRASDGQDRSAAVRASVTVIETEPPAITSVTLGGGVAAVAITAGITLDVAADASASEIRIRGDVIRPDPSWRPWAANWVIDLTPGDGIKAVRVQVRDALGNRSAEITDTIFLDQLGPSITVTAPSGTSAVTVDAALFITDPTPPLTMRIYGAVTGTIPDLGNWSPLTTSVRWWLPVTEGAHAVTIEAQDGFGHVATATVVQTLDRTPPTGSLSANLAMLDPVTLGTRPTTTTALRNVNLTASWSDLTSAVTAVVLSGDLENGGWITGFNAGGTTSGTASLPSFATLTTGDGPKTIAGVFVDAAGNRSASTAVTLLLDTTPPALLAVTLAADAAAVSTTTLPVSVVTSPDTFAITVSSTSLFVSPSNGLPTLLHVTYPAQLTELTLSLPLDGTHQFWVVAQDAAGNLTGPVGDSIVLDRVPPVASVTAAVTVTDQTALVLWFGGDVTTDVATIQLGGDLVAPSTLSGVAMATVTLTTGDGPKTIRAAFRDDAGNLTIDTVTVTLDAVPFSLAVTTDAAWTATTTQTLWLAVTEGVGAVSMQVTGQISNPLTAWTPLTDQVQVWLMPFEGPHAITVTVRDTAPETLTATVTVTLDTTPPSLSAVTLAGGGHGPVSDTALSLAIVATDATEMEVTGDVVAPTGRLALLSPRTVTVTAGEDVRTVWVTVYDAAGQTAGPLSDYVRIDTVAPMPPTAVTARAGEQRIVLTWSAVSDAADYLVYYGAVPGGPYSGTSATEGSSPLVVGAVTSTVLSGLPAGVTVYAAIVARDALLNASSASTEVSATPWAALDVSAVVRYATVATAAAERAAVTGTIADGGLGAALAVADLDGDGDTDLAIGRPFPGGALVAGDVTVLDAATLAVIRTLSSGNPGEQYGAAIAAGDFDGNGIADVAIGEPAGVVGQVYLLAVTDGHQIALINGGSEFGRSVAAIHDFDGDGAADLVIGEPGYNGGDGRVRQYDGATQTETAAVMGAPGARFGDPVVALGDVDGDGRGDWAAGATLATSGAGYVSIVSGGTAAEITRMTGIFPGSWFGQAITLADGRLAVGAPGAVTGTLRTGGVAVFRLTDTTVLWARWGYDDDARFGTSLAWSSDISGDGVPDLLVGAPGAAPGGTTRGAVYVLSGADGAFLFRIDDETAAAGSRTGSGLALFDDEIVVGAVQDGRAANNGGRVAVMNLQTLGLSAFSTTSATLAISATAAVVQLESRVAGGAWQPTSRTDTLAVTTPGDGSHLAEVRGVDTAGHRGAATGVTVRTDLAPPLTAWIAAPVSGAVLTGSATLNGAVTDAGSSGSGGMRAAEWALALSDGTGWRWYDGSAVTAPIPWWSVVETTGPVSLPLPTTGPGEWQVRLRGRDGAWQAGPVTNTIFQLTP